MPLEIFTSPTLDNRIDLFCRENKIKKDFSWHYKYLLSVIYLTPYIDRRFESGDFVPLNFSIIRNLVSRDEALSIFTNLINLGIVSCDGEWSKGNKSKGYKIDNIKELKWKLSTVDDLKLADKIIKRRMKVKANINMRGKGYEIANNWFHKIEIDYKKAKKYLDNHYVTGTNQKDRGFMNINMINDRVHFSSVDEKGNRLHTNLTVLPTPFRQFLTIDGKSLWQSDLANSQPVFLYTMLNSLNIIPEYELLKYRDVVASGKFYEFMAEKANFKDLDLNDYENRSKFKKTIFGGVLFDKNRSSLSRWEKLFKLEFPKIFEFIRDFKKKDYNSLAIALQKEESGFIFSVVEKVDRQLNSPILTTIHDCIISDEYHIDYIKEIMESEFNLRYGIVPKLKVEKC